MADIHEFKGKAEKPLTKYDVLTKNGELVTTIEAHTVGIDIDAEQIMFIHDSEELLALVPFGLVVTKSKVTN